MKPSQLAIAVLLPGVAPLSAAIVVDGSRDADYGAPLAVQTVQTQFGDNADPTGFGGGGEIDAGYARIEGGRLFVMVTGNIEGNFNKLNLFIDSKPGGENVLSGIPLYDFSNTSQNFGGLTFDAGFGADYHVFGRWGGGAFEVDFVDRNGGGSASVSGNWAFATVGAGTGIQSGSIAPSDTGTYVAAAIASSIDFGFNNTNIAGVVGGTGAANQAAAAAVGTGFEFSVALSDLGNPGFGDLIRIHAVYGNADHNFLSNQVLGGLPAPQGNLGGNGAGGFTGNLSGVDFNNFGGEQWFSSRVPEPSQGLLAMLGGLLLLRRRR